MKIRTVYTCQNCGHQAAKWLGKCPDCAAWNSLVEEMVARKESSRERLTSGQGPLPFGDITGGAEERTVTGISEFDRVLGGGLVAGSLVLIGGAPGIGKSTLVLQALDRLAGKLGSALYISGEESVRQIRLRGNRLSVHAEKLLLLAETSLEKILPHLERLKPAVVVVDSIQTIHTDTLESAPGSVSQVRECTGRLMALAKGSGIPVFIVGHVTKDGTLAGPRVLEHMVDTVLYFEGDSGHPFRILRAIKNRFGSTNEIGVFEMREEGLVEVSNPSELFLNERPEGVSGSLVVAAMEGSRPLLVELQALVTGTSFAVPRRTTIGVDPNRLALLVAVLEKKVGLHLAGQDIFLNVAGGVRISEPAADLGMIMAVASSHLDKVIDPGTVVLGEVGLAGEVRRITHPELRVREAAKLGFTRCIIPAGGGRKIDVPGIELTEVKSVGEALEKVM